MIPANLCIDKINRHFSREGESWSPPRECYAEFATVLTAELQNLDTSSYFCSMGHLTVHLDSTKNGDDIAKATFELTLHPGGVFRQSPEVQMIIQVIQRNGLIARSCSEQVIVSLDDFTSYFSSMWNRFVSASKAVRTKHCELTFIDRALERSINVNAET